MQHFVLFPRPSHLYHREIWVCAGDIVCFSWCLRAKLLEHAHKQGGDEADALLCAHMVRWGEVTKEAWRGDVAGVATLLPTLAICVIASNVLW